MRTENRHNINHYVNQIYLKHLKDIDYITQIIFKAAVADLGKVICNPDDIDIF